MITGSGEGKEEKKKKMQNTIYDSPEAAICTDVVKEITKLFLIKENSQQLYIIDFVLSSSNTRKSAKYIFHMFQMECKQW